MSINRPRWSPNLALCLVPFIILIKEKNQPLSMDDKFMFKERSTVL